MEKTEFLILSYLLFIIIQLGTCSSDAPNLDVGNEVIIYSPKSYPKTLRMVCTGYKEIEWSYPSAVEEYITIVDDETSPTNYVSTFELQGTVADDTNYYGCHYRDSDEMARTYVYVYDNETGVLGPPFIPGSVGQPLTIACRVTHPSIAVTLFMDEEEVNLEQEGVMFDPRRGFQFPSATAKHSAMYRCQARENSVFIAVDIGRANKLLEPVIETYHSTYFLVGHPFSLTCTTTDNSDVTFNWTLPRNDLEHTVTGPIKEDNSGTIHHASTLYVNSATLGHSGKYTCHTFSKEKDSNQGSLTIEVEAKIEPFVAITSPVKLITQMEGKDLMWRVLVKAYPNRPIVLFKYSNGSLIEQNSRISASFNSTTGEAYLDIEPLMREDHGIYHINAFTRDGSASNQTNVTVEVNCSPTVTLATALESYVQYSEISRISYTAVGHPLPNITWSFNECPLGFNSCQTAPHEIQVDTTQDLLERGNMMLVVAGIMVNTTGILNCTATNAFGTNVSTILLNVTDIDGDFVFAHSKEAKRGMRNFLLPETRMALIEEDNFTLTCAVSKFEYSGVEITTPSGISYETKATNFSISRIVDTESISLNYSGKYRCEAIPYAGGTSSLSRSLELIVKELIPPQLYENSTVSIEGTDEKVTGGATHHILCFVKGTPTPTIRWYKDGEKFEDENDEDNYDAVIFGSLGQELIFRYAKPSHGGTYVCEAENRAGLLTASVTLDVDPRILTLGTKFGLGIAVFGIVFLLLMVIVLVYRVKRESRLHEQLRKNRQFLFEKGKVAEINPDCTADEQAELLPYDPVWEIDKDRLKIGRQLGSGAFGRVVLAKLLGADPEIPTTKVAVKMCKSEADFSHLRALCLELKIMIHLGKHLNVVNLIGAYTANIGIGELWIVVEYCRYGNLLNVLHHSRRHFINQVDPVTGVYDPLYMDSEPFSPQATFSPAGTYGKGSLSNKDRDGSRYYTFETPNLVLDDPPKTRAKSSLSGSDRSDSKKVTYVENTGYGRYNADPNTPSASSSDAEPHFPIRNSASSRQMQEKAHRSSGNSQRTNFGRQLSRNLIRQKSSCSSPTSHNQPLLNSDMSVMSFPGYDSQGNPLPISPGTISNAHSLFTTTDLILWSWQVAQGMEYLARRKVLHGDLAARNLLLAEDNVVKISDFGLSRDMYKKDVYMKQGNDLMPIKWMAIEAIRERVFSTQSDVWAFGVTMWEMFTMGNTPYPGLDINQDFLRSLEEGMRMEKPKYANDDLYNVMMDCWSAEPMERPSFGQLSDCLGALLPPDLVLKYTALNDPFLEMNRQWFDERPDYLEWMSSPDFVNLQRDSTYIMDENGVPEGYVPMGSAIAEEDECRVDIDHWGGTATFSANSENYLTMRSTKEGSPLDESDIFSPRPMDSLPKQKFEFERSSAAEIKPGAIYVNSPGCATPKSLDGKPLLESNSRVQRSDLQKDSEESGQQRSRTPRESQSSASPYLNMSQFGPSGSPKMVPSKSNAVPKNARTDAGKTGPDADFRGYAATKDHFTANKLGISRQDTNYINIENIC